MPIITPMICAFTLSMMLYLLIVVVDCGPPTNISDSDTQYNSTKYGSISRHMCQDGFAYPDYTKSKTRHCQVADDDPTIGQWSLLQTSCQSMFIKLVFIFSP